MAVSADYEIEFDGVKICDGTNLLVMKFDPFSSPDIRSSDRVRGQDDGLFAGVDYLGGRTITLDIEITGETSSDFYTAYSKVQSACRKTASEKILEFQVPNWPYVLRSYARLRRLAGLDLTTEFDLAGPVTVSVQFACSDPRLYSSTELSSNVAIVGVQTGRTYNLTFNRSFGGLVTSNVITASNVGNFDAPWHARITGPVTNPTIEHVGSGKLLSLTGDIASGDYLDVYSAPYKTIMLNGTASRYSWLDDSTQWFTLEPGNNSIRFNGSSAGAPTMNFYWRPTWV